MDMANALIMAPREPGKPLTKEQVSVQQKIGSLKYIEKIQPKLSLAIHRLSCIMASPPPEAGIIPSRMRLSELRTKTGTRVSPIVRLQWARAATSRGAYAPMCRTKCESAGTRP